MNADAAAIEAVRDRLEGRHLVWYGIRGEDGESLLALPELGASYSIIAPMRSLRIAATSNVSFEQLSGERPDLDDPALDVDTGLAAREFRRRLLQDVSRDCVVMTYRPSDLVSAMAFSMRDTMRLAGLLRDRQRPFEHKPWVEQSLLDRGVPGLGWRYVADAHRSRAKRMLADGPQILRASRTSGGAGIVLAKTAADIDEHWPDQPDEFVAVAPFLDPTVPVNLAGCLFADGTITVHPPSVQLIGLASCTSRRFGYCGNDFAAASELGMDVLRQLQELVLTVGAWLHSEHYVGAFGVDALVHDGRAYFTEINPRFQGSSSPSAQIARELEQPSLFLDHLSAFLGLPPVGAGLSIADWAAHQKPLSHVVLHNSGRELLVRSADRPLPERQAGVSYGQIAETPVQPGGAICRVTMPRQVTRTGFVIDDDIEAIIDEIKGCFTNSPHAH